MSGGTRIYSQKLVGVEGPGCDKPKCRARRALSTGWLEEGVYVCWKIEFECPDHGSWLEFGNPWPNPWSKLIREVLADSGFRIYSKKLLGFEDIDCKVPKCGARASPSTGWLQRSDWLEPDRWYMEFECPDHGPAFVAGGPWSTLIEEVLKHRGPEPDAETGRHGDAEKTSGLIRFLKRIRRMLSA